MLEQSYPTFPQLTKQYTRKFFFYHKWGKKCFFSPLIHMDNELHEMPVMMKALLASQLTKLTVAKTNRMQSEVSNSVSPPPYFYNG